MYSPFHITVSVCLSPKAWPPGRSPRLLQMSNYLRSFGQKRGRQGPHLAPCAPVGRCIANERTRPIAPPHTQSLRDSGIAQRQRHLQPPACPVILTNIITLESQRGSRSDKLHPPQTGTGSESIPDQRIISLGSKDSPPMTLQADQYPVHRLKPSATTLIPIDG